MYKGCVEHHSEKHGLVGWCSYEDAGSETSRTVELHLYVGDQLIKRLNASKTRPGVTSDSDSYASGFKLPLGEKLVALLPRGSRIELRDAEGRIIDLPHGNDVEAVGNADDAGLALSKYFASGHVVGKWGDLTQPFCAKPEKRGAYMTAMEETARVLRDRLGLMVMPAYGTLLGYARSGALLEHDDDVDLAVMLPATEIEDVAHCFYHMTDTLAADGHSVQLNRTGQFHFRPKNRPDLPFVDMFAAWQTADNRFHTYFGVSGPLSGKLRYESGRLEGRDVIVPEQTEEILELAYGNSWRVPDPNFQWQQTATAAKTMNALLDAGSRLEDGPALAA